MGYKITYKDGKEESLSGYDEFEISDGFIEFSSEDEEKSIVYIATELIAKIE